MANRRVPLVAGAALVGALATGCGNGSTSTSTRASTAVAVTTTVEGTTAPGSASGSFTTLDGARYRVTVTVGPRPTGGAAPDCATAAGPGASAVPVTVTVANETTDRAAPFPPLRVELVNGNQPPVPVPVKATTGACSFTPRVSAVGAGASVTFKGATPPVDDRAAPGSAGRVQVSVSESTFSVSAPAP